MHTIINQMAFKIDEKGSAWGFWRHAEHAWKRELATEMAFGVKAVFEKQVLSRIQGMCGNPDAAQGCRDILAYIDSIINEEEYHVTA
jgi:hypothetical protein